nr:helix-turn-helix domain-containing protein [Archaeoglobus neptunius]
MPGFYTVKEVAGMLKVSERTVQKWCRNGVIRSVRLPGGQYRIPVEEVERLLRR